MLKACSSIALVVASFFYQLGATTSAPEAVGPGYVYGTVTDSVTAQTIVDAIVTIPGLVVTNNAGSYTARFTSDGTYTITCSAPGYLTQKIKRTMRAGTMNPINFALVVGSNG